MDLTVEVRDAAGAPIRGARVAIGAGPDRGEGTTDVRGMFGIAVPPGTPFRMEVTHPLYLAEEVDFTPPAAGGGVTFIWDNPVCGFAPPGAVSVRLSRLGAAPTFPISNAELERRDPFNPQAAFTFIDPAGNRTGRYLGLFNSERAIVPIGHPLLPDKPTEGWDRFRHGDPIQIDPSRGGDLVWLEWGLGAPDLRLLVAVWAPRFRGPSPTQLDFVIYFSPNTNISDYPSDKFPWRDVYPYRAVKGLPLRPSGPPALVQPYLGLGQRYLFQEKLLIYQLIAARRQAVVVFPIQPFGDWGPFAHAAGLARLVREVAHFLHRTNRTAGGNGDRDVDVAPSPGSRFGRVGLQRPLPTPRRIVLAGFSAGVDPIVRMMSTAVGQRLADDHPLFGADVYPFLEAWDEVWDHDAPSEVRLKLEKSAPGWLNQDQRRILRCYQSEYTGTPRDWLEAAPLVKYASGVVKTVPVGGTVAAERHADDRCSLVFFGSGYLQHATKTHPLDPVFWGVKNDHQAVPLVAFGHGAAISRLGGS